MGSVSFPTKICSRCPINSHGKSGVSEPYLLRSPFLPMRPSDMAISPPASLNHQLQPLGCPFLFLIALDGSYGFEKSLVSLCVTGTASWFASRPRPGIQNASASECCRWEVFWVGLYTGGVGPAPRSSPQGAVGCTPTSATHTTLRPH